MKNLRSLDPALKRNLLILFGAGLLFWASLTSQLPILPLFISKTGATGHQVGLVMGAFAIGMLGARSWLGQLSDRRGRKVVLLIGMGVVILAPLGYLITQTVEWLIVVRAFHGISIAAFAAGFVTMVVDLAPAALRGELLGVMTLVNPIGQGIGPAVGGLVYEALGYVPLFIGAAGLGVIGILCTLSIRESFAKPAQEGDQEATVKLEYWGLLRADRIRTIALMMLLMGIAFGTLTSFAPLLIEEADVQLNPGFFYSATAVASFMIRVIGGQASDRLGRGLFISLSLILFTTSMLILSLAHSAELFLIGALVEGAGFGLLIPMVAALMADRSTHLDRARTFSVAMVGFDLGLGLAGPLMGAIVNWIAYRGIFMAAGGLSFGSLVIFLTLSNPDLRGSLRFGLGLDLDAYSTVPLEPESLVS